MSIIMTTPKDRHRRDDPSSERESGQIILILALAMVGLLVAAGLATDAGVLFMRKAMLDRAVDAAALAGVVELNAPLDPTGSGDPLLPIAHTRGMQLLAANDIVLTSGADCNAGDPNFWDTYDYCGEKLPGTIPGSIRYAVEARWHSPLFFMPIIGFDDVPLRANATAEYMPLVDIYASDTLEVGLLRTSNQSIFGPELCTDYGDPYTPTNDGSNLNPGWAELYGAYTYRISIPDSYFTPSRSEVRVEVYDPDTYNQPNITGNEHRVYSITGSWSDLDGCSVRKNVCTRNTGDSVNPSWFIALDENRGINGHLGVCEELSGYYPETNTRTLYRLFYYEQRTDGTLQQVDLAYYIGKNDDPSQPIYASSGYTAAQAVAEAAATDMHWVSPGVPASERMPAFDGSAHACVFQSLFSSTGVAPAGGWGNDLCENGGTNGTGEPQTRTENCETYRAANYGDPGVPPDPNGFTQAQKCEGNGDFVVDFDSEVPGIYEDPITHQRQLFLQVRGLDGYSENGYEFWAGPSVSEDTSGRIAAPSYVNARQVFLNLARSVDEAYHSSLGVGVFGMGHLPMNSLVEGSPVDIPLAYLGPEFAGQKITIEMFDPDAHAVDPIMFYFDTISVGDWSLCYDDNGDDDYPYEVVPLESATCNSLYSVGRDGPANIPHGSQWQTPPYVLTIPNEASDGIPFYGGRLVARYPAGQNDTYGWRITLKSRPFLVR